MKLRNIEKKFLADFQILFVGFRDLPPKATLLNHIGLPKGKFLIKIFPQLALVTANDRSKLILVTRLVLVNP